MDADNCTAACGLVSKAYIQQGSQALCRRRRLIKTLLSQRRLPEAGWDDATIEMLLQAGGKPRMEEGGWMRCSIARCLPCDGSRRCIPTQTAAAPCRCPPGPLTLQDAALMDSNNFLDNVGVGEREARVASELVARRHYRLAHGIGRSGDIAAEQPKAAGSSLLAKLASLLAADALEAAGLWEVGAALVVPLATGMAITATLLALRGTLPPTARCAEG
jgi:O-phospho-L-seryl-tRNASec:L-selenocysteinyl-tRNA synthase